MQCVAIWRRTASSRPARETGLGVREACLGVPVARLAAITASPRLASGLIQVRAKTVNGDSWQPKTRTNRPVPIRTGLRAYLDASTPRPPIGWWYFPSPKGTRWDEDNFSADLRAANSRAGLVWTCLDFRHTFGSHLAQKGVSLYKISQLMGNSPDICRRHYAMLVPEAMTQDVAFGLRKPDWRSRPVLGPASLTPFGQKEGAG